MPSDISSPPAGRGTLLVVGGRPDTVRKAAALGLGIVLLQHKDTFAPETLALAEAVIIADYTDWPSVAPLVTAAHKVYGFTAAITLTEPALDTVGRINDLLGLAGTSHATVRLLLDKLAMRRHLARSGAALAAASVHAAEAADEEALRRFGDHYGYPFIVKPVDASASVGIHRVATPEQIPAVWDAVQQLRSRSDPRWGAFFTIGGYLAEQYAEGPEYSVEAFSFDGRHVVVGITEKLTSDVDFVELGHAQPGRLSPADEAAAITVTQAFLDAVGLRDGPSHTELRITARGPVIIEGHNRIGGDRIVDLLELTYGVDFELLTVGWPFRLVEPLTERCKPSRAAATQFLTPPTGVVREIEGLEQAREHPGVFAVDIAVQPGDVVTAGSNWDRAGQIVVTADDTTAALELCAKLAEQIKISVAPGDPAETKGES